MGTGKSDYITEAMKDAVNKDDVEALARHLKGKPADLADEFGETLLMHAALAGKQEIVKFLVETKKYDFNRKSLNKANALVRAALGGNLEVVEYLAERGVDLNANESLETVNACGYSVLFGWESHQGTALHAAIAIDSPAIVEYLVGKGADTGIKSPRGFTVFEQAVRYGRLPIIGFLVKKLRVSVHDQVLTAARLNENILKHYVDGEHAEFDFQDAEGMTPLMHAIKNGVYEFLGPGPHPGNVNYRCNIVGYLLEKGADANHRDARGRTPLMLAAFLNDSLLLSLLAEHGADPDARDGEGKQALDYIQYPEQPSESAENAYEAWCWENSSIETTAEQLRKLMKDRKKPPSTGEQPEHSEHS
jgi:ankyrin repeat protein